MWLTKTWFENPDVGVAASEFDHAEFFALAWAAVGLESKFEGRLLVSQCDKSNF